MAHRMIILTTVFLTLFLSLYKLGDAPVARWDEQTNFTVLGEQAALPVPGFLTHNGLPFLEKPPLWYTLSFIPVSVFGVHTASVRFVSALSGILTAYIVYKFSASFFSGASGLAAALILLSVTQLYVPSPGGFFATHTFRSADSDGLFVALFTASVYFFTRAVKKNSRDDLTGALCAGLATLTKGPLGCIPFAAYALYLLPGTASVWAYGKKLALPALILAAVTVPWHAVMYIRTGREFLDAYVGYHLFWRFATGLEGHVNPWWYYARILTSFHMFPAFPVTMLAVFMLVSGKIRIRSRPELYLPITALILYLAVIFVARTRLAWYILPVYPLLAMISGWWFGIKNLKFRYRNIPVPTPYVLTGIRIFLLVLSVRNALLIA